MKFMILVLTLFLGPFASARDGGISSGGGGGDAGSPFRDTAWFGDLNRTIRTCFEIDSKFGISEAEIRPQAEAAFKAWAEYIATKRVNQALLWTPAKQGLTTQVTFLKRCDGTEDLTIYFGGTSQKIEKYKSLYQDPVAIAIRTSHDRAKTWGKGFIWVSSEKVVHGDVTTTYPNWHYRFNVQSVLMHELGHVYGCGHVPGTIMTEHIKDLLNQEMAHSFKISIDITRQLYVCKTCTEIFDGQYAMVGGGSGPPPIAHKLVSRIMGYDVSSPPKVTLVRNGDSPDYQITFTDYDTHAPYKFDLHVTNSTPVDGPFIFASDWLGWLECKSVIHYAYLTTASGETIGLVLGQNLTTSLMMYPEGGDLMTIGGFVDGMYTDLVKYDNQDFLL